MKVSTLVIGAGPTGLAVSAAAPDSTLVLESDTKVGGLCQSIQFSGATFDLGGHSFHSPHGDVLELVQDVMQGNWATQTRAAHVWFNGALLDYPFQKHVDQISDPVLRAACSADPGTPDPVGAGDFESWIRLRFGAGVAEHFMLPYNRKLWGGDLTRLTVDWTGERVAGAVSNAPAGAAVRKPLTETSAIGYPSQGGFEEIFKALAQRCGPIECGVSVVAIDPLARIATTSDSRQIAWNNLVSTTPVPRLLRMIQDCPAELIALADRLVAVHLKIVMLALPGPVGGAPQRVYVADPDMPAHKIAFNHTSSPSLRALPSQAIMAEVSRPAAGWTISDEALASQCHEWLVDAGLLGGDVDLLEWRVVDLPLAYPVPTHDRAEIIAAIRQWLDPLRIRTVGRFGGWNYWNSDRCLADGTALGRELSSEPEGV